MELSRKVIKFRQFSIFLKFTLIVLLWPNKLRTETNEIYFVNGQKENYFLAKGCFSLEMSHLLPGNTIIASREKQITTSKIKKIKLKPKI